MNINDALNADSPLASALNTGLRTIDRNQVVVFNQYQKKVLSQDGFVFWIPTGITMSVNGSLHYATDRAQDEDQTIGVNHVIFTSEAEVTEFNSIDPQTMWIGSEYVEDGNAYMQVVFSRRSSFYQQADLWHYVGDAVYPALSAQIINSAADLPTGLIVSNSLPIWLAQNSFASVYPSFLVPDNVKPPYIVAHIDPVDTIALQAFPHYIWPSTPVTGTNQLASTQLMRDKVQLTLYGFDNQTAIQYFSSLIDYSLNTDDFGFCNSPSIVDDKRIQVELASLAQKKTLTIQASYYQGTADAVARKLILSAVLSGTTIS